MPENESYIKG